jgi:hypothetical protein
MKLRINLYNGIAMDLPCTLERQVDGSLWAGLRGRRLLVGPESERYASGLDCTQRQ